MIKKKKHKSNVLGIAGAIMFIAGGILIGALSGTVLSRGSFGDISPSGEFFLLVTFSLLFLVAAVIQIIIHEAGHLIAGLASGYRFSSFRIFSFMLVKLEGKLKLKRMRIMGTAGQCLLIPPPLKDGEIPVILYNMGGAAINILSALIFLSTSFLIEPYTVLWIFLIELVVTGVIFALSNGIPMRSAAVDNDGYNALSLKKNKEAMRAFWITMMINAENADGKRLKDMPEEWFIMPAEEHMGNSMIASLAVFRCNRLMDEKRFDEAEELADYLIHSKNGIPGLYKALLTNDIISIKLIKGEEYDTVKPYLTKAQLKIMKAMNGFYQVRRTEYIMAILGEKDCTKAEKIRGKLDKSAESYPYKCDIISEYEIMEIADSVFNMED